MKSIEEIRREKELVRHLAVIVYKMSRPDNMTIMDMYNLISVLENYQKFLNSMIKENENK